MSRYTDVDIDNKKLPPVGTYWSEQLVSLEEALRHVASQINELNRSIQTAKEHCHYPSEHKLTRDESAAVFLYTMEGGNNSFYRVLNAVLRSENRRAAIPWFPYLKLLDTALKKLPTIKRNIWRGVAGHVNGHFKKDQELIWWSVSSCSTRVDVIKKFLGERSTLFMIESLSGKDISAYTNFPNEHEVLLLPGTRLRVEGDVLDTTSTLHIVHLAEVDNQQFMGPTNAVNEYAPSTISRAYTSKPPQDNSTCPVCGNDRIDLADRRNADRIDADRVLSKGDLFYVGRRTSFCFFLVQSDGLTYVCDKKHFLD